MYLKKFLPALVPAMLAEAGVTDTDIERMLTVNAGNFMDIREAS